MKIYLSNLLHLPALLQLFAANAKRQKQFIRETVAIDIEESKVNIDDSLNENDFRKITNYYGFAVPAILGEGFCLLRGKGMTKQERHAMTYLGALTGLFDDFFDEKEMPEQHIKRLIEFPEKEIAKNANERLFVNFYLKALENAANAESVKSYFMKVFDAQVLSRRQMLTTITKDEIREITLQKGGISILFYRSIFSEPAGVWEQKMLYLLGGIGQLENDIFDVYKDFQGGINTLATTTATIDELRNIYHTVMYEIFSLVNNTGFPAKNRKKFLRYIALIISRGLVCLDFLEKNEKTTNNFFSLKDYEKKDLVCNMDSLKNNLKLLLNYAKCNLSSTKASFPSVNHSDSILA
jgi:hypothetical protein